MATTADVVSSKPVVAILAAITGFIGGATLTAPQQRRLDDAQLAVHGLRIERPTPGPTPEVINVEVYATARWTRNDGGPGVRDLGPSRCAITGPVRVGRLVTLTNAAAMRCDAGRGADWPHVVELMASRDETIDGGATDLYVYTSRPLSDGGREDLGQATCPPWFGELPNAAEEVIYKLAVMCAEPKLDDL